MAQVPLKGRDRPGLSGACLALHPGHARHLGVPRISIVLTLTSKVLNLAGGSSLRPHHQQRSTPLLVIPLRILLPLLCNTIRHDTPVATRPTQSHHAAVHGLHYLLLVVFFLTRATYQPI